MTDVLVIGAGGAGLVGALYAKQNGASVMVITKTYPTRSQTCMAQGGINASLANVENDDVYAHTADTLKSAQNLADKQEVFKFCNGAADAVRWLDSIGVPFSRTKNGKIAQRKLGGAASARACYAQDYTGLKILHTLYDQCNAHDIEMLSEKFLLDLIVEENKICGAYFLDIKTGDIQTYYAKSIILATGGYSRLYGKYSTNHVGSTGDGIAAALRAGVKVSNMEFIQFHPTSLKNSSILISESARGAGGYLLNKAKKRFTDELASRDKVSLAIFNEIENNGEVFLDLRHLDKQFIQENLPQEEKLAKFYENIDIKTELIPIKPAAHYTMGGISVNKNSSTTIHGLYAVGECANHHIHGANRLGGNSLLELIIFGKVAGENSAYYAKNNDFTCKDKQIYNPFNTQQSSTYKINFYEKRNELAEIFYTNVGIRRNDINLQQALKHVKNLKQKLVNMGIKDISKIYNTEMIEFLEFKNLIDLAEITVISAIKRKESRGAHFREDIPDKSDKYNLEISLDKGALS